MKATEYAHFVGAKDRVIFTSYQHEARPRKPCYLERSFKYQCPRCHAFRYGASGSTGDALGLMLRFASVSVRPMFKRKRTCLPPKLLPMHFVTSWKAKKLMKSYEILFLAAGILGKWPRKLRPLIMKCPTLTRAGLRYWIS